MSYRVIIEEPAQAEIEDALRWMAQHSPEAAALWHFDLTEAIESFQNFPRRCPLAYENEEFDEEIRHLILGKSVFFSPFATKASTSCTSATPRECR